MLFFSLGLGRILGTQRLDVSGQYFQLALIYQVAKISHKDNSNLFDNGQVRGGEKLNIKWWRETEIWKEGRGGGRGGNASVNCQ